MQILIPGTQSAGSGRPITLLPHHQSAEHGPGVSPPPLAAIDRCQSGWRRQVALNSWFVMVAAMLVGTYVLAFFGILAADRAHRGWPSGGNDGLGHAAHQRQGCSNRPREHAGPLTDAEIMRRSFLSHHLSADHTAPARLRHRSLWVQSCPRRRAVPDWRRRRGAGSSTHIPGPSTSSTRTAARLLEKLRRSGRTGDDCNCWPSCCCAWALKSSGRAGQSSITSPVV